jgi:hypothetical protein
MPLLSVNFPPSTKFVYGLIVKITQFNILPVNTLNENVLPSMQVTAEDAKMNNTAFIDLDIF